MAITKVEVVSTTDVNTVSAGFALTAASSTTDGYYLGMGGKDFKTTFIVANSAATAGTLTIKPGNSPRAAAEDLVFTIPASKTVVFTLDSGYWENVSGDAKGYVKAIPSATTLTAAVVETR